MFLRANTGLRGGRAAGGIDLTRALADNSRLWIAVIDQLRDSDNALPPPLRASIISVGLAVQREMAQAAPDLGFLIGINEQLAAGLAGQ